MPSKSPSKKPKGTRVSGGAAASSTVTFSKVDISSLIDQVAKATGSDGAQNAEYKFDSDAAAKGMENVAIALFLVHTEDGWIYNQKTTPSPNGIQFDFDWETFAEVKSTKLGEAMKLLDEYGGMEVATKVIAVITNMFGEIKGGLYKGATDLARGSTAVKWRTAKKEKLRQMCQILGTHTGKDSEDILKLVFAISIGFSSPTGMVGGEGELGDWEKEVFEGTARIVVQRYGKAVYHKMLSTGSLTTVEAPSARMLKSARFIREDQDLPKMAWAVLPVRTLPIPDALDSGWYSYGSWSDADPTSIKVYQLIEDIAYAVGTNGAMLAQKKATTGFGMLKALTTKRDENFPGGMTLDELAAYGESIGWEFSRN